MQFDGELEIRFFLLSVTPSEIRGRITAQRSLSIGGYPTGISIGNLLDIDAWLALSVLPSCVPPVYYSGSQVSTRFFSYTLDSDYVLDAANIEILAASPEIFLLPFSQRYPSLLLVWRSSSHPYFPAFLPSDGLQLCDAPTKWKRTVAGVESYSVYSYYYDNRTCIGNHFIPYQYEGFAFDYISPGLVLFAPESDGFVAEEYPLTDSLFDTSRFVSDFEGAYTAESHGVYNDGSIKWRSFSANLPVVGLRYFGRFGFPFSPSAWGFSPYLHAPRERKGKRTLKKRKGCYGKKCHGHFATN